ncbi:MAG: DUF2911 domain-containing protein [Bacteroidota bacterium]
MSAISKVLVLALFLLTFSLSGKAQLEYLRLSPSQKIMQRVGATDVTIAFSRPQMKGRKIFGGLVPYGKMWRTGANENTKISFSHRVKIGVVEVAEGTYSLLTKPNKEHWEIYFYTETNHLDVPNPMDSTKLIYLTKVNTEVLDWTEKTLVINLYNLTENTADLGISWENTKVSIPIEFYTKEAMELAIRKEMKQNIFDFSIAASYYHQRDIELEKAKKLQELAMELREEPSPWDYNNYGIILYKLGEQEKGLSMIEKSLELSEKTKNTYLIGENNRLIAEWTKKLGR